MDLGMYKANETLACGRHLRMAVDAQDSETVVVVKL